MAGIRNHSEEYRRRIESGLAKGLSRSQARGHAKAGETPLRAKAKPQPQTNLEFAVRAMNQGAPLAAAAKAARISPERLRAFIKFNGIAQRKGRSWVMTDNRARRVPHVVGGDTRAIIVPDFKEASRAGAFHNAIGRFVRSGDIDHITPFVGDGLTDIKGQFHPFETDPNELFRYAAKDEPAFHEVYQIVAN